MATQIHNADWNPAFVPCATTVPAQANPIDPPIPKAELAIPGSEPGSSLGACRTPSAAIGVRQVARTIPNMPISTGTMPRLNAKIARSAVTAMAKTRPARNTVTKPILTASRPINGATTSWTRRRG